MYTEVLKSGLMFLKTAKLLWKPDMGAQEKLSLEEKRI